MKVRARSRCYPKCEYGHATFQKTQNLTDLISAGPSGTSACRVMWRSNSRLAGTWCHNHSKTKFLKGQGLIDAKGSEGVIRLPASRIKLRRRGRRFRQPKRLPLSEIRASSRLRAGLGRRPERLRGDRSGEPQARLRYRQDFRSNFEIGT